MMSSSAESTPSPSTLLWRNITRKCPFPSNIVILVTNQPSLSLLLILHETNHPTTSLSN
ncbi:hypothetical protein GBAR_LOCUS30234 [Geodia barretti]|uniref:Uncharacterized protein n=1 Tax=Geodia barretti TaxID=519541 RepID=A0AA35XJY9_GEOBA|nr:hypothetical protein GBAR_LOCUS30234 [Geodia barretti]